MKTRTCTNPFSAQRLCPKINPHCIKSSPTRQLWGKKLFTLVKKPHLFFTFYMRLWKVIVTIGWFSSSILESFGRKGEIKTKKVVEAELNLQSSLTFHENIFKDQTFVNLPKLLIKNLFAHLNDPFVIIHRGFQLQIQILRAAKIMSHPQIN